MRFLKLVENKILPNITKVFLVISGVTITLLISFQIIGRYVGFSYRWTQEAARLLVIWATFASVSLGIKRESLLRINAIDEILPDYLLAVFLFIRRIILLLFSLVLIYYGFISVIGRWNQYSPGLRWPMSIFIFPLPFFSVFVVIHLLYKLIKREGN